MTLEQFERIIHYLKCSLGILVTIMIYLCVITLLLVIIASRAHAHTDCRTGEAAPPVDGCCGPTDHLLLSFDQARQDHDGVWHVIIDGHDVPALYVTKQPIPMLPSIDGCYHVWYNRPSSNNGAGPYQIYCLQGPFPT